MSSFRSVFSCVALAALLVRLPARGAEPVPRPVAVVDLHVDLPYQYNYRALAFAEGSGQFPARELLKAGVVGVVLPLFVPARVSPSGPRLSDLESSYQRVVEALAHTRPFAAPGCGVAGSAEVRSFFAFEGAAPLAGQTRTLEQWVTRGVRSVGLVHTRKNALATSSGDREPAASGLSEEGRALVERAEALGVPVDVSHASDRVVSEVVALARKANAKVIATHSNCRALADVPRNLTDAELVAIAETGGVVGINFHSKFLVRGRRAVLADVVRHIAHAVRIAGVEHVAIGSDFEGDITPPSDLADVRALPRLAEALLASGLSRHAVERILGLNALGVLCGSVP